MMRLKCQAGFALINCLMVSLIIVTIGLSMTFRVRQRINLAAKLNDRVQADLEAWSAYQELLFVLTASSCAHSGVWVEPIDPGDRRLVRWKDSDRIFLNFYGDAVAWDDGITVTVKDMAAMVPLTKPREEGGLPRSDMRKLLESANLSSSAVAGILDSLDDWQDADDFKHLNGAEKWDYKKLGTGYGPRNYYLQTIDELLLVKGMSREILDRMRPQMTFMAAGQPNYMNASADLLRAFLYPRLDVAEQVIDLRRKGLLTPEIFISVLGTGFCEEGDLFPSAHLALTVEAKRGEANSRISTVYYKHQTDKAPYQIESWQR